MEKSSKRIFSKGVVKDDESHGFPIRKKKNTQQKRNPSLEPYN